jgi:recombination DNA repair RAD52 pathway protein
VNYVTAETQKQVMDAQTIEEKIKAVNQILHDGEPGNISVDNYSGFTGYKPQYIFDALNAVFKIGGWGFEEVASEIVTVQAEKGNSSLAVAQVKVWLKGIDFQPVGYGQSRVTKGDIGDARKGSQTDAIKKALSYFSIGNRAYHGLLKTA